MFIRKGWRVVLLIAVGVTALYLFVYGPPEAIYQTTAGSSKSTNTAPGISVEGASRPDRPVSVRVDSELELVSSDRSRRSSRVYRIDYRPPKLLRIRVRGSGDDQPDSHQLVFDGRRYALFREGELFTAGTVDTNARPFDALPLPARHTYAMSFLLGDTPYLESPRMEKQTGGVLYTTSRQRVDVSEDGMFRRGVGPTRELERRYGPYGYQIDYAETATVLPSDRLPPEAVFAVPPRTVSSARGEVGSRLPEQTFRTLEGTPVGVRDVEGPRLINLWATWCPPCIEEIPALNRVRAKYGDRITVIGISDEEKQTIRQFKNNHEMGYRVWYSPADLPAPYRNHRGLPTSYLVDEGDRIRRVVTGARTYKQWQKLIETTLLEP